MYRMSTGFRRIALAALVAASWTIPAGAHAGDLSGKWQVTIDGYTQWETLIHTGNQLTLTSLDMTGTVGSGSGIQSFSVFSTTNLGIFGKVLPSRNTMRGVGSHAFNGGYVGIVLTRCNCYDSNNADGDGCDHSCRIEPCWTCAGDINAGQLSVCTPTPDGLGCNDYDPCTSGETCSAGVCTGAAVPACRSIHGLWSRQRMLDGVGEQDAVTAIRQVGEDVFLADLVGMINPASGAFDVEGKDLAQGCPSRTYLVGTVAADGWSYAATGDAAYRHPGTGTCDSVDVDEIGTLLTTTSTSSSTTTSTSSSTTSSSSSTSTTKTTTTTSTSSSSTSTSTSVTTSTSTSTTLPFGAFCQSAPLAGCRQPTAPRKSKLMITDRALDLADSLTWKWTKGAATTLDDLGDPTTTTNFSACLYDGAGTLQMTLRMPAGGTCWGTSCWKPSAKGFGYSDRDGTPDGVTKLSIVTGTEGRAKISLTAKGDALPMPALGGFPLPLRFQLQGNDQCWEAVYSDPDDDSALRFKASSD